jgi:thiamine pyrophosphokinase
MSQSETSNFEPAKFLAETGPPEHFRAPPDLLILNQPITNFTAFSRLWKNTGYRICADGGANRLFDMFEDELLDLRGKYVRDSSSDQYLTHG